MNFKKISALVMAVFMALTMCACKGEETVLSVGEAKMYLDDFRAYVNMYTESGLSMKEAKSMAREDATTFLSLIALMEADGLFTKDDEKVLDTQLEGVVSNYGGQKAYKEFLKTIEADDDFIKFILKGQMGRDKILAKMATPEEAKEYFNKNYYRAKHILVTTKDMQTNEEYDEATLKEKESVANSFLQRARSGEDFDTLVKDYSEDPGSRSNPDGYFFTDGTMVKEFEDTVKSLGMGEFGLCKSDYGYHIIQRLPLDDDEEIYNEQLGIASSSIYQALTADNFNERLEKMLKDKGFEPVFNEEAYNKVK